MKKKKRRIQRQGFKCCSAVHATMNDEPYFSLRLIGISLIFHQIIYLLSHTNLNQIKKNFSYQTQYDKIQSRRNPSTKKHKENKRYDKNSKGFKHIGETKYSRKKKRNKSAFFPYTVKDMKLFTQKVTLKPIFPT